MTGTRPTQTLGTKVQYLIERRATTSREELIAHWFANHMPRVIARNEGNRVVGQPYARRYWASLFDSDGPADWDGVAQLWYDQVPTIPKQPSGTVPADTFHEKVQPYSAWLTHEWVFIDGAVPFDVPTLDAPFPCTRSGFLKQVSLVPAKPGVSVAKMFDHWLDVHGPNVQKTLEQVGGIRYAVSLSADPDNAPYAGMAELYFPNAGAQTAFWEALEPDGFQQWADADHTLRFRCGTEMLGIVD